MPIFRQYYSRFNIITFNLPIPQLRVASRRIWIYLPPDYRQTSKRYPVIYMHDGQNLFDESTSYCGEWKVAKSINRLMRERKSKGAIVVGIDNGGENRENEYSPWRGINVKENLGSKYVDFIVSYLKPIIDSNLRTLPDRENTCVAGSSAGGLISYYAVLRYPNIFGSAAIFSPSFWYSRKKVRDFLKKADLSAGVKIYMDVGTCEEDNAEDYLNDTVYISKMFDKKKGVRQKLVIVDGAEHNEKEWAERFPQAFLWLFPFRKQKDKKFRGKSAIR